jgi:hypothetical protein
VKDFILKMKIDFILLEIQIEEFDSKSDHYAFVEKCVKKTPHRLSFCNV